MNELNILYAAMFGLMSMAVFLFLGFGNALKQSAQNAAVRRKKQRSFKPPGKLRKLIKSFRQRQLTVIEQSPLPGPLYVVLTVCCSIGGFFAGRVVYNSLFLSFIVGILALLVPMIVLSFRQSKAKSKWLNRLASSMMILSNSFLVTEDFITTVEDNLEVIEYPEPFRDFLTYVTMMNSDVRFALRRMENKVRAVTVRAINLIPADTPYQTSIFEDAVKRERREKLDAAVDDIRNRYGKHAIFSACLMGNLKMPSDGREKVVMPGMMYQ